MSWPIYTEVKRQIESGLLLKTEGHSRQGLDFWIRGFKRSDSVPSLTVLRKNVPYKTEEGPTNPFLTMMMDVGRVLRTPEAYFREIVDYRQGRLVYPVQEPLAAEISFQQQGESSHGDLLVKMDLLTRRGEFLTASRLDLIAEVESSIANAIFSNE